MLCTAFEAEVRALEDILIKEMKAKAQTSHADNPNKIFQDMRKPQVSPVQMLTDTATAKVTEVEPAEMAFCVEHSPAFDPEKPLLTRHGSLQPVAIAEDKIWVEDLSQLEPGDEVSQETHIGDLNSLFAKFGDDWASRWDKHRDTPESFWTPILEFIESAIPLQAPMKYERITAQQIRHVVRSKKPHAATGPDGWSRRDVLKTVHS